MQTSICSDVDLTRLLERWLELTLDQPLKRFPGMAENALPLLAFMAAVLDDRKPATGGAQALEHFVQHRVLPFNLTRFDQLTNGFLGEHDDIVLSKELWGLSRRRGLRRLRSILRTFATLGIRQIDDLQQWLRAGGDPAHWAAQTPGWSTCECRWLAWRCLPLAIPQPEAFRWVAERALGRRLGQVWLLSARQQLQSLWPDAVTSARAICALDEPGWVSNYDRPALRIFFWKQLIDRLRWQFPTGEVVCDDFATLRYASGGARWIGSGEDSGTLIYLSQTSWIEGYSLRLSVHGSGTQRAGLSSSVVQQLACNDWLSGSDTMLAFSSRLTTTSVIPPLATLSSIGAQVERVEAEVLAQLSVLRETLQSSATGD